MSDLSPLSRVPGSMDEALEEMRRREREEAAQLEQNLKDKMWRLTNLYHVVDEDGQSVRFEPRPLQLKFLREMWYLNCILKARQHGFTTLITLWILDECLFYDNQTAGIIAHNLEDGGKIFRNKIKHPYEKLPDVIKEAKRATNDKAQELVFANGSSIGVSTSTRSGTCQYLLVTEFGKIAAKFPEKADEIVTGAFNTVHEGNYLFVESSAEGRSGHFFDLCKRSRDMQLQRTELTKLDFKFHFYPWYINPEYEFDERDAARVMFTKQHHDYFAKAEKLTGEKFSIGQKAFYVKKKQLNGPDLIKREYPTTADEAFEASIKGAYFGAEIQEAREQGRIGRFPHEKGIGVDTWWDLGLRDKTAIWFVQVIGREARLVDYYEESDKSMIWFITDLLPRLAKERGYFYRHPLGPHDLMVREFTTGKTRLKVAKDLGVNFKVAPQMAIEDQIEAARNFLSLCWFDAERCDKGIEHLENYRKEWNEHLGVYMEKPVHDEHSHGASAFMTGACMFNVVNSGRPRARPVSARRFAT